MQMGGEEGSREGDAFVAWFGLVWLVSMFFITTAGYSSSENDPE